MIKLIVLVTAILTGQSERLEYYHSFDDVAACEAQFPLAASELLAFLGAEYGIKPDQISFEMTCEPTDEPPDPLDVLREMLQAAIHQGGFGTIIH